MRIFISYPREVEEFAKEIYWELQSWGFLDVFLDSETIRAGDTWKVVIEKQIREASVLIILYDHGAEEDKSRYFCRELERIKEECKNIRKLIITVRFPPTTQENLPVYLKARHVIASTKNGRTAKEIDPVSIDKVIQEVQRRETDRQEAQRQEAEKQEAERLRNVANERRKQMLTFALLIAAIVILAGIVIFRLNGSGPMLPGPSPVLTKPQELEPDNPLVPWAVSKRTCEALVGEYQLLAEYKYVYMVVEKKEIKIKATSIDGSWTALSCKKNKGQEGSYLLEGKEQTKHRIEVGIKDTNGKEEYVYVADATNKSDSEITINKDGGLANRRILYKLEEKPEVIERNLDKQYWKKYGPHIRNQLNEYKGLTVERHRDVSGKVLCIPTHGKKDDIDYIASLCSSNPPYIRVMMKVKDRSL